MTRTISNLRNVRDRRHSGWAERFLGATLVTALCAGAGKAPDPGLDPAKLVSHTEQGGPIGAEAPHPEPIGEGLIPLLLALGVDGGEMTIGSGTNGFDTRLYVPRAWTGEVVAIDPTGAVETFVDLGDVSPGSRPGALVFDHFGAYGGKMLVNDLRHSIFCTVTPAPEVAPFPADPDAVRAAVEVADPFGNFGGKIFIARGDTLVRLESDGSVTEFATGLGADVRRVRVFSGPLGDGIIALDAAAGRVLLVEPDHQPGAPAAVWLDLHAMGLAPVDIALGSGGAFPEHLLYILDATRGRIVTLDPEAGEPVPLVRNLTAAARIELPAGGTFEETLLVADRGSIWRIVPGDRAEGSAMWIPRLLERVGIGASDQTSGVHDHDHDGDVDMDDLLHRLRSRP